MLYMLLILRVHSLLTNKCVAFDYIHIICMYVCMYSTSIPLLHCLFHSLYLLFQQIKCEVQKARRMVYSNTVYIVYYSLIHMNTIED